MTSDTTLRCTARRVDDDGLTLLELLVVGVDTRGQKTFRFTALSGLVPGARP